MKKRIITWMFSYEINDTRDNGFQADHLYKEFQAQIEHKILDSEQVIAYIHKESKEDSELNVAKVK